MRLNRRDGDLFAYLIDVFSTGPFTGAPILVLRDTAPVRPALASALAIELARPTIVITGSTDSPKARAYRADGVPAGMTAEVALAAIRVLAREGQTEPAFTAADASWPGRTESVATWVGLPRPTFSAEEAGGSIPGALGVPAEASDGPPRVVGDALLVPVRDAFSLSALPVETEVVRVLARQTGTLSILLHAPGASRDDRHARAFDGDSGREAPTSGAGVAAWAVAECEERREPVSAVFSSSGEDRPCLTRVRCARDAMRVWVGGGVTEILVGEVEGARLLPREDSGGRGDPVR